ncbi:MAG: response regulator, partial [bacterium]|nr:response regulator [bacterium]
EHGFFLYDLENAPKRFKTEADEYIKVNRLYHGIILASGEFAFATLSGGVVILGPRGQVREIISKDSGLPSTTVYYLFQDGDQNLWLAQDMGITKIEYGSPFRIYDQQTGPEGMCLSLTRHREELYAGTNKGLFRLSAGGFKRLPTAKMYYWDLYSQNETLLAATSIGVLQVTDAGTRKIYGGKAFVIRQSATDQNRLWVGRKKSILSLYLRETGYKKEHVHDVGAEIRTLTETHGGIWLGTKAGGLIRVELTNPANGNDMIITHCGEKDGLPTGEINVFTVAGHVVFASIKKGLFRFDKEANRFVPDLTFGDRFAAAPDGKGRGVFRILENADKSILLHSKMRNMLAVPNGTGGYTIHEYPFSRLIKDQVNHFYPDPASDVVWFACNSGLTAYHKNVLPNRRRNFCTLLRRVTSDGVARFAGMGAAVGPSTLKPPPLILSYAQRKNIRFDFTATFFEAENKNRFQWQLEGRDKTWATVTDTPFKEYSNLGAGPYTFRVRAQNIYGDLGREAAFSFTIRPPWYGTWWAWGCYIILIVFFIHRVVRWRSGKLEREKKRLERIVSQRTGEIDTKNRQLEDQTGRLKEQARKLQEMDNLKSRFFANISHRFRTPLTLIMGPLERMLADQRSREEKEQITMMQRNSRQLLTSINHLLDLSRFADGKMELHAVERDVVPFLRGIFATFQVPAGGRGIEFDFTAQPERIPLWFDAPRLEEACSNLLGNAVKFTPPGGTVSFGVQIVADEEGEACRITVDDSGPGITRQQLPHIFDRFYTHHAPGSPNGQGTGIGLALTRELVNLHHGRIDVHSTEGEGTRFSIYFPVGNAHLSQEERNTETQAHTPDYDIAAQTAQEAGQTEATENAGPPASPDRTDNAPIILVVEDNTDMRRFIRGALESEYSVHEAVDGKDGIGKAQKLIPDLIVSDVMMPNIDGFQLCSQLKQDIRTSHIPIILLTAKASEAGMVEGLETGADDYITKPFSTKILKTRIRNLIDLRRMLQEGIRRRMLLQPAEIKVSSMDEEFLRDLRKAIERHLGDEGFNVEGLSEKLFMNRATVYRKITALTGETPTAFIRSYRLQRGAQLLRDNFGTVSQVAMEVGFTNISYFAKCFKEKFHQSPSEFQVSRTK